MKKLRPIAALAAVLATAAAAGCAASPPAARTHPRPVVLTASQVATLQAYSAGDTAFGLDVLGRLCRQSPGSNVALSPVSLATGLGMAWLGARGATAAAIAKVLHLPAGGPGLVAGLRARWAMLGSLTRPGIEFSASNLVWADPSLPTSRRFTADLRKAYAAPLQHVPLRAEPARATRTINATVARETRGHIPHLLAPGSITSQIGWVLTDALYLRAAWAKTFTKTASGPFSTATGDVTARYLQGGQFAFGMAQGWTAAALPYRGHRLEMLALLPPGGSVAACRLPSTATLGLLESRIARHSTVGQIALPKIDLSSSSSLRSVLTALGMGLAFSKSADFSGISRQACCIAFVQHAATLTVNAKGTVASAATGTGVSAVALPSVLHFDRPYLVVLRDTLTGEPLMAAWVANPATH
jgi:serine protease inhibitor